MIKLTKSLEMKGCTYPYYYSDTHICTQYWIARRGIVTDCHKHIYPLIPGQQMPDLNKFAKDNAMGLKYHKTPWIYVSEYRKPGHKHVSETLCRRFNPDEGLGKPIWINENYVEAFGLEGMQRYDEENPGFTMSLSHDVGDLFVMEMRNPVPDIVAKAQQTNVTIDHGWSSEDVIFFIESDGKPAGHINTVHDFSS